MKCYNTRLDLVQLPSYKHPLFNSVSVRRFRFMRFHVTLLFPEKQLPHKLGVFTGINKQRASVHRVGWLSHIATPVPEGLAPSRAQPHSLQRELVDI